MDEGLKFVLSVTVSYVAGVLVGWLCGLMAE